MYVFPDSWAYSPVFTEGFSIVIPNNYYPILHRIADDIIMRVIFSGWASPKHLVILTLSYPVSDPSYTFRMTIRQDLNYHLYQGSYTLDFTRKPWLLILKVANLRVNASNF